MSKSKEVTLTWWVTSSEEHVKEVFRWDIWLKVPHVGVVFRRLPALFSTLIVLSPLIGITQNSIRIAYGCERGDIMLMVHDEQGLNTAPCTLYYLWSDELKVTFKCLCSTWSMILVWMEFQCKFSIWSFQFVLRCIRLDPQNFIEVLTLFYSVEKVTLSVKVEYISSNQWQIKIIPSLTSSLHPPGLPCRVSGSLMVSPQVWTPRCWSAAAEAPMPHRGQNGLLASA